MAKERYPQVGFIFGIINPETGFYIYVGISAYPRDQIYRLCTSKKLCPSFYQWFQELKDRYQFIEVLDNVVMDRFQNAKIGIEGPDLPPQPGVYPRMEWDILDEVELGETGKLPLIGARTKKAYWMKKLAAEGHPLLSQLGGRPRKVDGNA